MSPPPSQREFRGLFATDLDGTLLDRHGVISQENIAAIRKATESGVMVAIVTGRRCSTMRPQYPALEGLTYRVATSNGAVILAPDNETPESFRQLPWSLVEELCTRESLMAAHVLAITAPRPPDRSEVLPDCFVIEAGTRRWLTSWTPHMRETLVPANPMAAQQAALVHAALHLPTRAEADEAADFMARDLPPQASVHVVVSPSGQGALAEVVPKGGKSFALQYWQTQYGLTPEQTGAIGDELNDLDLLDAARHRFAVGGSVLAEQRRDASVVVPAEASAVAEALNRFLEALDEE
ncbi:MAG: HAD family hydrolase [Acidobacteriota bacterium]